MSNLIPVDPPDLQPLRESFEFDQLETELKAIFMKVFADTLRPLERRLNLYGIPHRGDIELIERAMKDSGLAILRRNETRAGFLLKAARSRNPRRGMHFLRQYLQSVWPNVWMVEPLWHPIATAANYPVDRTSLTKKDLGFGVVAEYDPDANDGEPKVYRTNWQGKQLLYKTPRTNEVTFSEDFANAAWSKASVTIGSNVGTAPDGTVTADRLIPTTASASHSTSRAIGNFAVGDVRTSIIRVKKDTGARYLRLTLSLAVFAGGSAYFDLDTGAVSSIGTGSTASMTALSDGWWECTLTAVATASGAASAGIFTYQAIAIAFAGDGVSGPLIWGAEVKSGGPSSYIKTDATPVTVTDYTLDANGVATFATGPAPVALVHFLTPRIRVTLPVQSDNGLGLVEIGKAFRSTLAARLMLELRLSTLLENIGETGGLALANGVTGMMPFTAIGTLQR